MTKIKKIIIASLFILATVLIIFRFNETPKVWIDEGIFTETAKNLALHGKMGIRISPTEIISSAAWSTAGYPLIFPVSASFKMFGVGLVQARLPMIFYMIGLSVVFYLFASSIGGFYAGVLSLLLILSFSPFYGNGRAVQGEVPGLLFLITGALLLLYWEKRALNERNLLIFGSGALFGLAAASKPLYLILILPTLFVAMIVSIKKTLFGTRNFLFFVTGFIPPLILWIFTQFPNVQLMKKAFRIYISGNPDSSVSTMDAVLANIPKFFTESTPIIFLIMFIAVAVLYSIKIIKNKYYLSELIIFIFIILNWLAFLKGPGWYRHFFPGHVLLYLMLSLVFISAHNLVVKWYQRAYTVAIIPLIIAVLVVAQFLHMVVLSQTSLIVKRERNINLAESLGKIKEDKSIFLYNAIEAAIFIKHDNYYQFIKPSDFLVEGDENGLTHPSADFILVHSDYIDQNSISIKCYNREKIDQYYLFEKENNCAKDL